MNALLERITEDEWKSWVIDYARARGWRVAHFRPALTGRGWRTPMEGDAGFPDLVLARRGTVLFRELKRQRESPRPDQRAWLEALGGEVWRPGDRELVERTLL